MHLTLRSALFSLLLLLPLDLAAQTETTSPGEAGSGEMLVRHEGGYLPLPQLHTDVAISIEGVMAHARLTQRFQNVSPTTVEALYVFPLPENASVHHMEMIVGDRRIVSKVQEKGQAKATYAKAQAEGKKASLVEQERVNLFTASLANLNPGETVEVVLDIVDEVTVEDGRMHWTFPLTFTPRYVPPEQAGQHERVRPPFQDSFAPTAPTASFRARLRPGLPVERVECRSHAVEVTQEGEDWILAPKSEWVAADRDIRLEWRPRVGSTPEVAWLRESRDSDEYGLLLLMPPRADALPNSAAIPTQTLFVIDVSGSMDGPSIVQARRALLAALDRLGPDDQFDILRFNDSSHFFAERFVGAHGPDHRRAQQWVRDLRAENGTEIFAALRRAIGAFHSEPDGDESPRVRRIVFLTDGAVGNEDQMLERIAAGLGDVRLHTIGIGAAPNRALMRAMAQHGGGLCAFVADPADAHGEIDRFFASLDQPVWTDLQLEWPNGVDVQTHPSRLPDLHAGQPVFVSARWKADSPLRRVVLKGASSAGPLRREFALENSDAKEPVPASLSQRWARRAVQEWMDSLHSGRPIDEVRPAVVALGLEHHLLTAYTSLVAVEERITAVSEGVTVPVPNALPVGSTLMSGSLPRGGRHDDLLRLVALATLLGGALLIFLRSPGVARPSR